MSELRIYFLSKPRLILIGIVLFLSIPFVNRPLFVDDHAAFSDALDISHRGWTPFRNPHAEYNPPVYSYIMGAFTSVAGNEPWKAHLFLIFIQLLAALSLFQLSSRFVRDPLWACVGALTTIHYWATSNALLIDSLLAPIFIIALTAYASFCDKPNLIRGVSASILLLLPPLIKYTALLIWPVGILWWFLFHKKNPRLLLVFLPSFLGFSFWTYWTKVHFGQSHLVASARFGLTCPNLFTIVQFAAFVGGTTPLLLIQLKKPMISGAIFLGAIGLAFLSGLSAAINLTLGAMAGIFFVWLYQSGQILRNRDHKDIFLFSWLAMGTAGLILGIPWVCARFLVILTPALILITQRCLEATSPDFWKGPLKKWIIFCPVILFSLAVVCSDYNQASADKRLAMDIRAISGPTAKPEHYFYPGALLSGLSFYLAGSAWQPMDPGAIVPDGAYLIFPRSGLSGRFLPKLNNPQVVQRWIFSSRNPLRTYGTGHAAGFYGSIWGPLPYSWVSAPLEEYLLVRESDGLEQKSAMPATQREP